MIIKICAVITGALMGILPVIFREITRSVKMILLILLGFFILLSVTDIFITNKKDNEIIISDMNMQLTFRKRLGELQQHEIDKYELTKDFPRRVTGILHKGNGFIDSEPIATVIFTFDPDDCIINHLRDYLPAMRYSATVPYKMYNIEMHPESKYSIESIADFKRHELSLKIDHPFDNGWYAFCPIRINNTMFYNTSTSSGHTTMHGMDTILNKMNYKTSEFLKFNYNGKW